MAFMDGMTDEQQQMMQLGVQLARTTQNIARAFQAERDAARSDLAAMTERAVKAERELARTREIQQEAFRVSADQSRQLVEARDEIRRLQAELRQARGEGGG